MLPMVGVLLYAILLDEEIKTIRDLLDIWWVYLIPAFNIFFLCFLSICVMYDFLKKTTTSVKLSNAWDKLLTTKLPKIYDTKL